MHVHVLPRLLERSVLTDTQTVTDTHAGSLPFALRDVSFAAVVLMMTTTHIVRLTSALEPLFLSF